MYHKDFICICVTMIIYTYEDIIAVMLAAALMISIATSLSDRIAYAHNFSESEMLSSLL
jgi:hypothetical protein